MILLFLFWGDCSNVNVNVQIIAMCKWDIMGCLQQCIFDICIYIVYTQYKLYMHYTYMYIYIRDIYTYIYIYIHCIYIHIIFIYYIIYLHSLQRYNLNYIYIYCTQYLDSQPLTNWGLSHQVQLQTSLQISQQLKMRCPGWVLKQNGNLQGFFMGFFIKPNLIKCHEVPFKLQGMSFEFDVSGSNGIWPSV